jgi:F0F1-type ATP synthase assembly protein I
MKYLAGLLVFSGIGSFLISDTIAFWRELERRNSRSPLYLDFFRILILGVMAGIGYMVASETFQKPNDWIIFLVAGIIGAVLIQRIASNI